MREILIESIIINPSVVKVVPTHCPGSDREDILKDQDGIPSCVVNTSICKYLNMVYFNIDEHKETLLCELPEEETTTEES